SGRIRARAQRFPRRSLRSLTRIWRKEPDVHAWSRLKAPGLILVSIGFAPLSLPAQAHGGGHWTYKGEAGPAHWGSLDTAFASCATGHAQSPIDIHAPTPEALPGLVIEYQE